MTQHPDKFVQVRLGRLDVIGTMLAAFAFFRTGLSGRWLSRNSPPGDIKECHSTEAKRSHRRFRQIHYDGSDWVS